MNISLIILGPIILVPAHVLTDTRTGNIVNVEALARLKTGRLYRLDQRRSKGGGFGD